MTGAPPLLGITRDGRPMTRVRVDQILAESEDFRAVESPALSSVGRPPALMSVDGDTVTICAWHEGGRGKLVAERWASFEGHRIVSHGCCADCQAAVSDGTWRKAE